MTTEIASDFRLRVGTHRADDGGSEVPRPETEDVAHAARSRMDQDMVSRLHLVRSMQEILRGHPLQEQSRQVDVIQWQVLWNLDQLVSRVQALLTVGAHRGKAGAHSLANGEPVNARTQLLDLADALETEDHRRIADDHRMRNARAMVRIGEVHADGPAAKPDLATPGRADVDLF